MKDPLKYFRKSLQILQKTHPALAHQLTMIDPTDAEFCWTQKEELNLKRQYEDQSYYYHSPISALEEAHAWFQSLDLHLATTIFIYGIGLGYYYEAAKGWLKQHPHHVLIFLEEDLSILFRLCETEMGWHLLKDPQVQLVFLHDAYSNQLILNELSWAYFETPFIISSLKLYNEMNPEGFLQLRHEIAFQFEQKKELLEGYLQFGFSFFRNFYSNLLELPHSYWGNGLVDCFSQVPAIICGTGPSLAKNIDLLPALKNRAILFAGGTALHTLISKEIIPHFGVAIDPHLTQYSSIVVTQPYQIPFFYRTQVFHEALIAMTGPRLYLTGTNDYKTSDWFERQLHLEGKELDGGHHVVNFSLHLAQALGCNPIILVGTDLAEQDFKMDQSNQIVLTKDIHGKPVYTLWKWIKEAERISDFAIQHPQTTFLNATEGGLGFKGFPNLSLQEVIKNYLEKDRNEIATIDQEIRKHSLSHLSLQHIRQLMEEMKESLDRVILLFSKMIEECDQLNEQIKQGLPYPPNLSTSHMILLESDIEEEISYQFILDTFSQLFLRFHHRKIQDLQSSKRPQSKKKRAGQKLELEKQRFVFLRDTARANREIIHHTIEEVNKR